MDTNYIIEKLGIVYCSNTNQQDLKYNYTFLLQEKNKLIAKIKSSLEKEESISLESWEIDLLFLDTTPSKEEYITYYNLEELELIRILKLLISNPEKLKEEDYNILYSFFRNHHIIDNLIKNSSNGLKLNPKYLQSILILLTNRKPTTGINISTYESLCISLSLNIPKSYSLEKKIAA